MSGLQDEIPPPPPPPPSSSQTPTQQTPHTVSTIKLPILKKGEYDIWAMKMEHYLTHTDYPTWEVIQNGNGPVSITTDTQGQINVLPPRTAEEIVARERERYKTVGGKHACVDLTGVSPLVGLSSRGFTAGQAALKAALGKVTKHEKACNENQYVFIPFAFDTFGFLAPKAVELLNRVQRVMHNNVMTPRSTDVVFKRIGFAIQKRLAAQLVARLPSTTIDVKVEVLKKRDIVGHNQVLEIESKNVKALYGRDQALYQFVGLCGLLTYLYFLMVVIRDVKPEYKVLKEKMNAYNKTDAKLYGNMFAEDLNEDGGYVAAYWRQVVATLIVISTVSLLATLTSWRVFCRRGANVAEQEHPTPWVRPWNELCGKRIKDAHESYPFVSLVSWDGAYGSMTVPEEPEVFGYILGDQMLSRACFIDDKDILDVGLCGCRD
ncbi:hypothetical protein Tco_1028500 [Tanacetum coccineum]|uniref:Uncharacterized protein n=1 Tax=Tanacetum coccineum TaxID=301880 RepID=A0ABQ5G2B8_9ASTR